jgi:hypothetical protein
MCAYMSKFHLDKLKARASADNDGSDSEQDPLKNIDDDSDAAYALRLALQDYDEQVSRAGGDEPTRPKNTTTKSAKGSHAYSGEIHQQQSVLKSYLSSSSRGGTKSAHDPPSRSLRCNYRIACSHFETAIMFV